MQQVKAAWTLHTPRLRRDTTNNELTVGPPIKPLGRVTSKDRKGGATGKRRYAQHLRTPAPERLSQVPTVPIR